MSNEKTRNEMKNVLPKNFMWTDVDTPKANI